MSFLASRDRLPNAVVVHLGSNGPASKSEVVEIIEAAEGRRVVFVTAADLHHPDRLVARIAAALGA